MGTVLGLIHADGVVIYKIQVFLSKSKLMVAFSYYRCFLSIDLKMTTSIIWNLRNSLKLELLFPGNRLKMEGTPSEVWLAGLTGDWRITSLVSSASN